MTSGELAVFEALMRANEADAAMSDDQHPGCALAELAGAHLERMQAAVDTMPSSPNDAGSVH